MRSIAKKHKDIVASKSFKRKIMLERLLTIVTIVLIGKKIFEYILILIEIKYFLEK